MIGLIITTVIIVAVIVFNSDNYRTLTEYLGQLISLLFKVALFGLTAYVLLILPSNYLYHC